MTRSKTKISPPGHPRGGSVRGRGPAEEVLKKAEGSVPGEVAWLQKVILFTFCLMPKF